MALKKVHNIAPKKSDAKKKMEASNSKTKAANSKQNNKRKLNEFGEDDAI